MSILTRFALIATSLLTIKAIAGINVSFVRDTEETTLPEGWSASQYQGSANTPYFKLGANGAVVNFGWKQNTLVANGIAIDSTTTADSAATIEFETYSATVNANVVFYLASDTYSVCIGNSYTDNTNISIGDVTADASTRFISFQNNTGTNPQNITTVAAAGELAVNGPLVYNLTISGTALTGTVSDGSVTKSIAYTLPATYSFTKIGFALDSKTGESGVKRIRVNDAGDSDDSGDSGDSGDTGIHTFTVGNDRNFYLDGKPFLIRCAEMHFARIPRAYWRQRIQMAKAGGFNAVCAYMFWNNHEPEPGHFRFDGEQDVREFVSIAKEEGMWVILRPGPYTCAEWEFGGFPWWLIAKGAKLRTKDEVYNTYVARYLSKVGEQLSDLQITRGGNILMVQVENEYGFWGNDTEYIRQQYNATVAAGFDGVQKFNCNPSYHSGKGNIPEMLPVVNGGGGFDGENGRLAALINSRKGTVWENAPLMVGEYYPAWYDTWGQAHQTKDTQTCLNDLSYLISTNCSFSMYMAHGGTSFAWWAGYNGANAPLTSSYDYEAPISEAGHYTDKFYAFKTLFEQHLNEGETAVALDDLPAEIPMQSATISTEAQFASLWNTTYTSVTNTAAPLSFEFAGLGYGYAVYSTTIPAGLSGRLRVKLRDLGIVKVDGEQIGYFDARHSGDVLWIEPSERDRTLEILVEAMGREHFGSGMNNTEKGILGKVTLGAGELVGWTMKIFDLIEYKGSMNNVVYTADTLKTARSGSLYKYTVALEGGKDTYLDMHDWKRGMVCVNGHWIGRYWSIGPTQTMYVPGCWLNDGDNEIIILDTVGAAPASQLKFVTTPVLNELRANTDFYTSENRTTSIILDTLPNPTLTGNLANNTSVQTKMFPEICSGRYFVFKATSSHNTYAACAECNLLDADGNELDRTMWQMIAWSSEETSGETAPVDYAIDGDTSTFWHSKWQNTTSTFPQYFVIDLGSEQTVSGFTWMGRQTGSAGFVNGFEAYVLRDSPVQDSTKPMTLYSGEYTDDQVSYCSELIIAGGTVENPILITDTEGKLNSKPITIKSGAVLKILMNGNKTYTINGEGDDSILILASTKDWGLNDGSQLRDLTLIIDDPAHKFWIEGRETVEAFDSSVDVVIANNSPIVVNRTVTIGSLTGGGNMEPRNNGTLIISDPTGDGYTGNSTATLKVVVGGYDITAACTGMVLDPTKSIEIQGEVISVTPALGTIDDDDVVAEIPFAIKEEQASVGVKTIPGVVYQLLRWNALDSTENTVVDEKTADSARTKLTDSERPAEKAFYTIRVGRGSKNGE